MPRETGYKTAASSRGHHHARRTPAGIIYFLSIITAILLAANAFVLATWNHFYTADGFPWWEVGAPVLTLGFVATTVLGRWREHFLIRWVYRISAVWLGFLNFAFFAAAAAWFFSAVATLLAWPIGSETIAKTFLGAALLAGIYGLINANRLRVTPITVKLPHLPPAWRGRTAVLVTDLHLGNVRGEHFLRRVVARIEKLQPRAVFISGDMFDGTRADFFRLAEPWQELVVPGGIYFVSGNHEEFGERAPFLEAVRQTGIRVLDNEMVTVDGLQIAGVHDGETHDPQVYRTLLRAMKLDGRRASVLLAHQPAGLAVAAAAGISLQLSGHTHRGQVWPWSWLAARVHGRFTYGLNRHETLQVLTSSGAGTWGPPLRVGTKSEIVLIRFESAGAA